MNERLKKWLTQVCPIPSQIQMPQGTELGEKKIQFGSSDPPKSTKEDQIESIAN